ncbi:unnamed protein product, partial [Meganyctiphanes norvegica]
KERKVFTTWNNIKVKEEISSDEEIIICKESKQEVCNEVESSSLCIQEEWSYASDSLQRIGNKPENSDISLQTKGNKTENTHISNVDKNSNVSDRIQMNKDCETDNHNSYNQEGKLNASSDWETIQLGRESESIEDDLDLCNIAVKIIEDGDSEDETTKLATSKEENDEYSDSDIEILSDYSDVEILGAPEKNVTVVDLIDVTEKEENIRKVTKNIKKTKKKHKVKVSSQALFNCTLCNFSYKSKYSLEYHYLRMHSKSTSDNKKLILKEYNQYACKDCDKVFPQKFSLDAHKITHNHKCAECYENFKTVEKYEEHFRKYHPFQCLECEKKFTSVELLKKHYKEKCQKDIEAVIACSLCFKTFINGIVYQKHMQEHLYLSMNCEFCGHSCSSKMEYQKHLKTHAKLYFDENFDL